MSKKQISIKYYFSCPRSDIMGWRNFNINSPDLKKIIVGDIYKIMAYDDMFYHVVEPKKFTDCRILDYIVQEIPQSENSEHL